MDLTLTLSPAQMQILSDALVQLPYFKAAPLIAAINAQVQAQQPKEPEQ